MVDTREAVVQLLNSLESRTNYDATHVTRVVITRNADDGLVIKLTETKVLMF
jgi:hypothetical protein